MIKHNHNLLQIPGVAAIEGIHFVTILCPQGRVIDRLVTAYWDERIDDVHRQSQGYYFKPKANQKYTNYKHKNSKENL